MYKEGMVKKLDLLRAEDRVNEFKTQQKEIESKLFETKNNFKILLNLSLSCNLKIEGSIKEAPVELNINLLKKKLCLNNPILQSLDSHYKLSKLNVKLASSEFLPVFNLGLQYNYRGDSLNRFSEWDDYYTFSLNMTYNIFKGFSRKTKVSLAKAQRDEMSIKVKAYQDNMKAELENSLKRESFLRERVAYSKNKFKRAREEYELAELSYNEGMVTYTDLELSQTRLVQSELEFFQAIYGYYINIFKIETFISEDIYK